MLARDAGILVAYVDLFATGYIACFKEMQQDQRPLRITFPVIVAGLNILQFFFVQLMELAGFLLLTPQINFNPQNWGMLGGQGVVLIFIGWGLWIQWEELRPIIREFFDTLGSNRHDPPAGGSLRRA